MSAGTIIGLATATAGILAVLGGIVLGVQTGNRLRTWRRAEAEVLKASASSYEDSEGVRMYRSSYEVRIPSGEVATVQSQVATNSESEVRAQLARHPRGSALAILFNPGKPNQIMLQSKSGGLPWAVAVSFAAIGFMFILAGGVLWFANQPRDW